jgi:diacylglycerol kinase family enzyme
VPPPVESLERLGANFAALDAPVERKRMLVIVNPYATTVSDELKSLVVYALQGRYDVEAVDTQRRGHATELCREAAAEGLDVVVAFGGDGTVNEAANGLIGSRTPLTCLPGGATNVFAKMLGIPGDIVDATEHLLRVADDWRPRRIDMASVNGRHFTFSAGVGLDAAVVRRCDAHPERKARYKQWYFAAAAVATFCQEYLVHPPRLETHARGRVIPGVTSVVQNGDPFTYFANDKPVHVAEGIALDDGRIAGVVLGRATLVDIPTVAVRLLSRRLSVVRHRRVEGWSGATEALIASTDGRPVPLEVDGDWIGDVTEARFGVTPRALSVVA